MNNTAAGGHPLHLAGIQCAAFVAVIDRTVENEGVSTDESEQGLEFEIRLRRADGVFHWFLLRRQPYRDESGAVVRWYGTGIDIEEGKQRELLRVAEKRTLEMIADGASLTEVLNQLCNSIDIQVAPSFTTVLLMDADRKRLWQGGGEQVPRASGFRR